MREGATSSDDDVPTGQRSPVAATGRPRVLVIGGAVYAIGPWALWALVGAAGLLSAQLCLPRRRAASTVDEPDS